MSWIDRINNIEFSITTGDGKVFKPLWKSGEKSIDANVSEFDYIDVEGTEVVRKRSKSGKYPLTFYFQGEDNIEQADEFEKSSKDQRFWTVNHPFYGSLNGHFVNITRNDNNYNVTEISIDFWESIDIKLPKSEVSVRDKIQQLTTIHSSTVASSLKYLPVASTDVKIATQHTEKTSSRLNLAVIQEYYNEFQLVKSEANSFASKLQYSYSDYLKSLNNLIQFPVILKNNIEYKLNLYQQMFDDIIDVLDGKKNNKHYFEAAGSFLITSVCNSLINPSTGSYLVSTQVLSAYTFLNNLLNQYYNYLDLSLNNSVNNSFVSSFDIQSSLANITALTFANLQDIAFDSKKEKTIITDKDSNLILLVHKYIGLDSLDENIENFRKINNIKNMNLFKIPKGTKIKFFV